MPSLIGTLTIMASTNRGAIWGTEDPSNLWGSAYNADAQQGESAWAAAAQIQLSGRRKTL